MRTLWEIHSKSAEDCGKKAKLDTGLYIDLMPRFILVSGHFVYKDGTPQEQCPEHRLLADGVSDNNTDEPQDPVVEDVYGRATFTFTSNHDPSVSAGAYKNSTQFTLASIMNCTSPMMFAYGVKCVDSGKELRLECVFPVQFPFDLGGPTMERPTQISEEQCLQHYLRLSLPHFMLGDVILVVLHIMHNRIMSFRSDLILIMCRSPGVSGQSFAEMVSTLTEGQQIKTAVETSQKESRIQVLRLNS